VIVNFSLLPTKGNLGDVTEKSWDLILRSTNALILARTGEELDRAREATHILHSIACKYRGVDEKLVDRFYIRRDLYYSDFYIRNSRA